jgi:NADPH-dependent curcumin reductase CurA
MDKEEKVSVPEISPNLMLRRCLIDGILLQNRISHRYKALLKLKQWLAETQA